MLGLSSNHIRCANSCVTVLRLNAVDEPIVLVLISIFADVATSFDNKGVVKPYHVSVGNAATVNVYFDVPVVVVVIFVLALELFHAFREAFIMGNHVEFVVVEPFNWSDIFLVVEP